MVISDFNSKKVFLDTAPLIYFIDGHSEYQPLLSRLFKNAENGDFSFATATITLLELLVKPLQEGKAELANQYKSILTTQMELFDVTASIAERAALLRSKYPLKTPDAIQIATAIETASDYFLTNDIRLKSISDIPVVCLNDIHFWYSCLPAKTMKIKIEERKIPIVRIDKSLNKYDDQILFPEKLAKANEMLRKTGLPKQWLKTRWLCAGRNKVTGNYVLFQPSFR